PASHTSRRACTFTPVHILSLRALMSPSMPVVVQYIMPMASRSHEVPPPIVAACFLVFFLMSSVLLNLPKYCRPWNSFWYWRDVLVSLLKSSPKDRQPL